MWKYNRTIYLLEDIILIRVNSYRLNELLNLIKNVKSTETSTIIINITENNNIITFSSNLPQGIPISFPIIKIRSKEDLLFTVKFYIQKYLYTFDGIFIHGSCVISNNKAYLFIGKSGSGKTTIAKTSKLPVLSDDMCTVKVIKNNIIVQRSNLDVGVDIKMRTKENSYKTFPLAQILLLKQSKTNKLEPISPFKKFNSLIENTILVQGENIEISSELHKQNNASVKILNKRQLLFFKKILAIAHKIKFSELHFQKSFIFHNNENLIYE